MSKAEELINLLVQNKLITAEQLAAVKQLPEYSANPEAALSKSGLVSVENLTKFKAKVYGLNYGGLIETKIPEQVLNLIPLETVKNYKVVCFAVAQSKMKVGLTDPENFKAIEAIDFLARKENLWTEYFLISSLSFANVFKQYETLDGKNYQALEAKAEAEILESADKIGQYEALSQEVSSALEAKAEAEVLESAGKKIDRTEVEKIIKSAPVSKIVSVIIRHAIEGKASDVHIEPMQNESRVRYRIDGILHTSLVLPKSVHGAIIGRIKVLANLKLDETRMPQDGRIRVNVNNKDIDLRISILPLLNEEKVAVRILDVTRGAPTLKELGFIGAGLKTIKKSLTKTDGMFLITGPTGSGKSTTLFSVLTGLNQEGINISTLEDPVEYFIKGINQSQVRPEIGFTFASGLRSLLRQDPNIVMVGEVRDNETAELVIHASLTGHFVLSTLHTNDALGAIPRFLNMAVEPFLLGSTLNIILAQRLARKICEHCRAEYKLPDDIVADIKKELAVTPPAALREIMPDFNIKKIKFHKGKGCARCGATGYAGRIALAEVLDVNDKIKEIIMNNRVNLTLNDLIKNQNFITMKQDGIIKVLLGLTTIEEVLRTIHV